VTPFAHERFCERPNPFMPQVVSRQVVEIESRRA
jgi:hypothetical protein